MKMGIVAMVQCVLVLRIVPQGRGVPPTAWVTPHRHETLFSFGDHSLKGLKRGKGKASTGISEPTKGSATVEHVEITRDS